MKEKIVEWIKAHKTLSIIAGIVVAAVTIFVSGYITGCI